MNTPSGTNVWQPLSSTTSLAITRNAINYVLPVTSKTFWPSAVTKDGASAETSHLNIDSIENKYLLISIFMRILRQWWRPINSSRVNINMSQKYWVFARSRQLIKNLKQHYISFIA